MRWPAVTLIALAVGGIVTVAVVEFFRDTNEASPPVAMSGVPVPATTTMAAPPVAFCPETGYVSEFLPTGTSQQGPVQVVVCEYATPTNQRIGTCDGYQLPGRGTVSVVVTGVQYAYKAYDADSKRLLDAFALPGVRLCPGSVTTIDDVPRSIEARSDYTAVITRLLPHLRT